MNPRFTPADLADLDLLLELMGEFYAAERLRFDVPAARRALQGLLRDRAFGIIHLIHWGAEVIGYVVLTFGFSLEFRGRFALLDELYVRERFRARGAGKASLQWIETIARQEGIHAVHLEVERANTRAQAVYRRAGYATHDRDVLTRWLDTD
jgi:GNAT superfamily N-acetyltransferase